MDKVLAVDIGGSKVLCGVVDENGIVGRTARAEVLQGADAHGLMDLVIDCALQAMHGEAVRAVGVNIPGLADSEAGVWLYAPFSGIENIPVASILRDAFSLPVATENDVNACALAEMRFGCCKGERDFLWVTVSTGVGGAVVMDGAVRKGAFGNAGEIGHIVVEEDPAKALMCGCGRPGCLEAMAAGPGIAKRYGEGLSAKEVAQRAAVGEPKAAVVMEETGRYLGVALAACANVLNPAKVVLGGGVSEAFSTFQAALGRTLQNRLFVQSNPHLEICATPLGYRAALLGAAAIALCRAV